MPTTAYGSPIQFTPGPGGGACGTTWRFVLTDLEGVVVTFLDHLASEKMVTMRLNEPSEISCTVPSDNPEINILHTDGFPFVAEGVRLLYAFRRESDTSPYYTIRASGVVMQVDDAAHSDDARTRITAWDPWQYMMSRPVTGFGPNYLPLGVDGISFDPASYNVWGIIDQVIGGAQIAANSNRFGAHGYRPSDYMFLQGFAENPGDTWATIGVTTDRGTWYRIEQGTSVGEFLADICSTGEVDIVLNPIWDPWGNPGSTSLLTAYSQANPGDQAPGAGINNYAAQFAWDRPGRNTVGMDNLYDGVGRANIVQFYNGQGGPPVYDPTDAGKPPYDLASINMCGEYWAQQFFPAQQSTSPVLALARQQLDLRSRSKQTLTVNPAPCRAPQPFIDYNIGDRVPVYASNSLRQKLPPGGLVPVRGDSDGVTVGATSFTSANGNFTATDVNRYLTIRGVGTYLITGFVNSTFIVIMGTPPAATNLVWQIDAVVGGPFTSPPILAWQRIYGIPLEIDDNGTETVRELIVGPVGGPVIGGAPVGAWTGTGASIGSSLRVNNRVGAVNRP